MFYYTGGGFENSTGAVRNDLNTRLDTQNTPHTTAGENNTAPTTANKFAFACSSSAVGPKS